MPNLRTTDATESLEACREEIQGLLERRVGSQFDFVQQRTYELLCAIELRFLTALRPHTPAKQRALFERECSQ
jgi:hypothetical protein